MFGPYRNGFGKTAYPKRATSGPIIITDPPQRSSFLKKFVTIEIIEIYLIGLETVRIQTYAFYRHAQISQKLYQIIYIEYIGNIVYLHFFWCQQCSTQNLQRLHF